MSAPNVPSKTPLGHDELRTRRQKLSQRHRTVLLLVDGQRPLAEVLSLVQRAGASLSHFEDLVRMGLVELPVEAMAPEPAMTEPGALSTLRSTHLELEVPAPAEEPEPEATPDPLAGGPPGPQAPAAGSERDAADAPPLPAVTAPGPPPGGAPEAVLLHVPEAALPGAPEAALPGAPEAALPGVPEAALPGAPEAALPGVPDVAPPDAVAAREPGVAPARRPPPGRADVATASQPPVAPVPAGPEGPPIVGDGPAGPVAAIHRAAAAPARGVDVIAPPEPAAPRPPPRPRQDHDALSLRTAVAELPDLAGLAPPRAPSAVAGRAPAARRTPPAARMPDPVVPRRRVPEPQPTATHDDEEAESVAERVRRSLLQVAQDNPVPFVSRLLARIEQASTLDELRDLVLEVERRLRRPASGGAARLQEARELLGLGNTVVTGDSRVDWPSED